MQVRLSRCATAAIDDEGRSNPTHGIVGLPNWITDPRFPPTPRGDPCLVEAVDAGWVTG